MVHVGALAATLWSYYRGSQWIGVEWVKSASSKVNLLRWFNDFTKEVIGPTSKVHRSVQADGMTYDCMAYLTERNSRCECLICKDEVIL